MNSIRIFEPKVTMFTTTVEIPVRSLRVDGIANGKDVGILHDIFEGDYVGTLFHAKYDEDFYISDYIEENI